MKQKFLLWAIACTACVFFTLLLSCKQRAYAKPEDPKVVSTSIEVAKEEDEELVVIGEMVAEAAESEIISRGVINDRLYYEFNTDGDLWIYGDGPMRDFEYDADKDEYITPWREFKDQICYVAVQGPSSIGNGAFHELSNLEYARLSSPISKIGDHAFSCCQNLRGVEIKDDLDYIGEYAFSGCRSLSTIEFPLMVKSYGREAFVNTGFRYINLPEGVKSIPPALFYGCENLEVIELPSSLREIDTLAFSGCNIEEIDLPDNLRILDYSAFLRTKIESITIPENVKEIKHFGSVPNITEVIFRCKSIPQFVDISSNFKYYQDNLKICVPQKHCMSYKSNDELANIADNITIYPYDNFDSNKVSSANTSGNYNQISPSNPTYHYPSNITTPAVTHSGHYETSKERCSQCMGRGYNEKMIWHGGDRTSTARLTCHTCHGTGFITKREYILDYK